MKQKRKTKSHSSHKNKSLPHRINHNKHSSHISHLKKEPSQQSEVQEETLSQKKVSSGIPNFDTLIEGGFEKNSTNLVIGSPGGGKTVFAMQFLVEGMKKGERCLYVSFEERKENFFKNMNGFGWDAEEFEKKGLLTFLEYNPIKVKTMIEEGGGAIESIIIEKKISRLVIDSVTYFSLLFRERIEKRDAALALLKIVESWNCTTLLTLEGKTSKEEKLENKTSEFESDSIILLYFAREKNERERFLEILKMKGTNHSREIYKFQISKVGIIVDKKPYKGKLEV